MKTLVAYYSKTGSNEKIAKDIQEKLGCDIEKIVEMKNHKGIVGFFTGGMNALFKKKTEIKQIEKYPASYDVVIIISPIWAGFITPAVRTYISENRENLKKVAFLSVSGNGEGNKKTLQEFESFLGKKCIASLLLSKREMNGAEHNSKIDAFLNSLK